MAVAFRFNTTGRTHALAVMAAMQRLRDLRILQIPSLLVTALVGTAHSGATVVRPIDNIPRFLESRDYSSDEFEHAIQSQAVQKLRALAKLDSKKGVF